MHTHRLEAASDIADMLRAIFCAPKKCLQDQPGVWLYFEPRQNRRNAILLPLSKWPDFQPAAGGGGRSGSRESAAAHGGDGLARVR